MSILIYVDDINNTRNNASMQHIIINEYRICKQNYKHDFYM